MRVLLVVDCVGGVFSFALELSDALHAAGDDVVLAVMGAELQPAQRAQLELRPWLRFEARPFRMMWMDDPWDDVAAAGEWLLRMCTRHRPDVVHLNDYAHVDLPWRVPVLLTLHSCVTTWFAAVHDAEPPAAFDRYRATVRRACAAADVVVAPTRAMLREFERCNLPCPDARVVRNGIEQRGLCPAVKSDCFLSVGRVWDPAKDLARLGEAARTLPWPVLVAGPTRIGGSSNDIRIDGLRVLGELPRRAVHALLARAAVYVHPAVYEPFGLAPLEAAAAGCALVLSDLPTLRELWGGAALLVPPRDTASLSAALLRLVRDSGLRLQMAERARARACDYTASRMARGYRAAYVELLQSSPIATTS